MFKFILPVVVFLSIATAKAEVMSVPFTQNVVSFDEAYFESGDVEVLKIEREYKMTMGGYGPFKIFGDYVITLKVRNKNYEKGFEIDHDLKKIKSARFVGSTQGYDLWEVRPALDSANFDLNVYMPAKLWNGTPTYGTPAGPKYFGPSFNLSISKL